jgi:hypothetical protein
MFKSPKEAREKSLYRILRNQKIYFAIFYKENPLKIKVIYEIEPEILSKEAEKQLDRSSNNISHVGFSERWATKHYFLMNKNFGSTRLTHRAK